MKELADQGCPTALARVNSNSLLRLLLSIVPTNDMQNKVLAKEKYSVRIREAVTNTKWSACNAFFLLIPSDQAGLD